jgi:hypothetical protein
MFKNLISYLKYYLFSFSMSIVPKRDMPMHKMHLGVATRLKICFNS